MKLAVFASDGSQKLFDAAVTNIGTSSSALVTNETKPVEATNHTAAANVLLEWLAGNITVADVCAVGYRIVHGGPKYYESCVVTDEVLDDLKQLAVFDPEHLPVELNLVGSFKRLLPNATHVACFDTAFHHGLPARAQLLPLPRKFVEKGLRRYGFHGLSYAFIVEELRRVEGDAAANGKVIIAHLGSGASLAALQNGASIETTMSMTPASGIPMSTRAGDLDPSLSFYFAKTEGCDTEAFNRMINFESGLLGISETTADMKKLLQIEHDDPRAKDAVDIFCYNVRKQIGALAAALSGLNTLVFTGGMGEDAPKIRARVCSDLEFLGVKLDDYRNQNGERLISADGATVGVHVIHTDEAVVIAHEAAKTIHQQGA